MSAGNYLGQSSQNIIIGLGQSASIDSLILVWPSGVIDHYFNLNSNQFQLLTEAETLTGIQTEPGHCPGEPATASLMNWPVVQWSNNDTGATTTFNTPQISATVGTGFGHVITLTTQAPEEPSLPIDLVTVSPAICLGENNGQAIVDLLSNSGDTLAHETFSGLAPGDYSYSITYNSTCQTEVSFSIGLVDSTEVIFNVPQQICAGDSVVFEPLVLNSNVPITWNSIQPYSTITVGNYSCSAITANGCSTDTAFIISQATPPLIEASTTSSFPTSELLLNISGINQPFACTWSDGTSGNIFYWDASTQITALIVDGLGCEHDSTFVLTDINELEENITWHSTGDGIYFTGNQILHNVEIYNEVGQLLDKRQYLQANTTVSTHRGRLIIVRSEEKNYFFSK
jgi:hypothetical protein